MKSAKWKFCCGILLTPEYATASESDECPRCGGENHYEMIDTSLLVGLVGFTNTGKTVSLATLYDQLSHSSRQWNVKINDEAFEHFAETYKGIGMGRIAPTVPAGPLYLFMRIIWQRRYPIDLIMFDVAGEHYSQSVFRKNTDNWPAKSLEGILARCRSIMVTIACEDLQRRRSALPDDHDPDREMARLFRALLATKNCLRQVIVLLVGIDVYAETAPEADRLAHSDFDSQYRIFAGVIKNARIALDVVPISNIGLGNTWEKLGDGAPLNPYNVLEPVRRLMPFYLPWWRRLFRLPSRSRAPHELASSARRSQAESQHTRVTSPAQHPAGDSRTATRGSVFVSYRRDDGSETARLLRRELQSLGWQVFLDVDDLRSSYFDERLLLEVDRADSFIIILSPDALSRCVDAGDFLRQEIARAIALKKRIVPVIKDGFTFPQLDSMPADIRELARHNGVRYSHDFFQATLDKLVSFLAEAESV
jgi:hypothetical protein